MDLILPSISSELECPPEVKSKMFTDKDSMSWPNINWKNLTFLVSIPLLGILATFRTPLQTKTAIWALIYLGATGLGITAGYHRLWSHRSYCASLPLQIYLAIAGAAYMQGPVQFWARDHRAHHRYTDTEADPYSVQKGLLYAHIGWLIFTRSPDNTTGRTNTSDLDRDPTTRNFRPLSIFAGLAFPCLIAGIGWGDWAGGFLYAGILRTFIFHQSTFCVNSLAHWLGEQPYADTNTPRDHVLTAILTLGEGYHNFHHEFPNDYRNAYLWLQYDPTKWFIWLCRLAGFAHGLKRFQGKEIAKSRYQQSQKRLERVREGMDWGVPLEKLPLIDWDGFRRSCSQGGKLVAIEGVVYDVRDFAREHPGGEGLIGAYVGVDATAAFNGGVYRHSNAARNVLVSYRAAVLRGGGEVECWKC